jgi:Leucine-rich repeat (LRR) protein
VNVSKIELIWNNPFTMDLHTRFLIFLILINGNSHQSQACPKKCACSDVRVDCYSRRLESIPEGIPESVRSLDLHDNEIKHVNAETLSSLSNLESLFMKQNRLTDLKFLAFVNLPKLKKLYVGGNEIKVIGDTVFANLPLLQDLDLAKNNLTGITGDLNISGLMRLYLSYNRLKSLQDNTLNGVRSLQYLILDNNDISYISKSAFAGMTNLSHLFLRGNPIRNVDHTFEDIGTLSYLDISACILTHLPRGLPWALHYLKISDNNLTMIESRDLYSTRYLGIIFLDNNNIEAIQDGALLYTPYLKELRISHNKLRWLPQIPNKIETIYADNNNIKQLYQYNFAHDSVMRILSLSGNQISNISPYTFSRLANLTVLLLDHNEIRHLKNMTFANLRKLITVNLEFNPLERIERRAFGGLSKLEQLKLGNSKSNETIIDGVIFQDIPSLQDLDLQNSPSIIHDILNSSDLLRSLRSIKTLNLMNGSLETITMEVQTSLPNLDSLKLSGNPWLCNKELVVLRSWINNSPKLFGNSRITCASPDHLRGRNVKDLSVEDLILALTFTSSYVLEDVYGSKTSMYEYEEASTMESHIGYVTYLSKLTVLVSPTIATRTETFPERSLPEEQAISSENMMEYSQPQLTPSVTLTSTECSVALPVEMLSSLSPTTIFSFPGSTTSSVKVIDSRHSMQPPNTCTTEEASTTSLPRYTTTSPIHSTSTVISQPIPTEVPPLSPTNGVFTDIPDITQMSKQTTKLTSLSSSSPTTSDIISITQINSDFNNRRSTLSATASNIITNPDTTSNPLTLQPVEASVTRTLLPTNTLELLASSSSIFEMPER